MAKAEIGDVLFVSQPGWDTRLSAFAQARIDADASDARRRFGHVAIVVSDLLALEAMPDAVGASGDQGGWSGAELRSGVRLVPIADLVVPSLGAGAGAGADLLVLRAPRVNAEPRDELGVMHPTIVALLGSAYSINTLADHAAKIFWPRLIALARQKADWRSQPTDLAARMGLDDALREEIAALFPGLDLPLAQRSYFCSQLVLALLKEFSFLEAEAGTSLTTPTGLHQILSARKWLDVTEHYRCGPKPEYYLGQTQLGTSASYTSSLALALMAARQASLSTEIDLLSAAMNSMNDRCGTTLSLLRSRTPGAAGEGQPQ